jgi:hypothetical protein
LKEVLSARQNNSSSDKIGKRSLSKEDVVREVREQIEEAKKRMKLYEE